MSGTGGRQAALGFVFVAALLDVIALGIMIPVLPGLIENFAGSAAAGARWIGWFGAIFALMQLFASPVLGALSDRFGRRPVLLLSMTGMGLDYAFMAMAPNLGWLFVGRIISGVTSATFATANAYIADITPPEQRAARFGFMSVAFGIGFILGPALGGLLGAVSPRLPFWASAALCLANALYGLLVLPESLPRERRAAFSLKLANPVGAFDLYRTRAGLMRLAVVLFCYYLAHQVLNSTWVPYTTWRYGWTPAVTGMSLAIVGVGSIVVQGLVVSPFVARFGERGALMAGLLAGALGFFGYAAAPTTLVFMGTIPIFAFMGLIGPGIQGLMSRSVDPTEQGRLQGANTGLMALASLGGPILFTELFARAIGDWRGWAPPGTPFALAALLMLAGLAIAASVRPAAGPAAQPAE